ncbi:AAA family ATPase [Nocardioides sp. NBC_00368]|uniref:helix-turn-helix transcriptional regulator n=1 Tax=Nocardioides sp. NBC_00368 TaxID=2976000 RepID=UPI002E1A9FC6
MAPADSSGLLGRREECRVLDELVSSVRAGRSASMVLRGEAGIGKTELLQYLLEHSSGCRTLTATGIQSEMELSYAGLHQLCGPLLTELHRLPEPQANALATAFGLRTGDVPDRFLVGLATLSLLAAAAEKQPLVCIVDDAQWMDQASALTLAFVARRLLAESVLIVFAVRHEALDEILAGLPELTVAGLSRSAARQLLDSVVPGRLDNAVRDRILAEARGNPLAILELPYGLTAVELAEGFGEVDARPLRGQIEQGFHRRVESLPEDTRRILVTAAADPVGDAALLRSAAERLGVDLHTALSQGDAAELVDVGTHVRFRHPLVRSAIYRTAPVADRLEAHRVLAESTDADVDPDRRAWHRAQASPGPDEDVAIELERSAARAQARGGVAAMAAFLETASALTPDPATRSQRALDAAQAKIRAGAFEQAAALLEIAESGPNDEYRRARTNLLNAQIALAYGRGSEATPLLLSAARQFERFDVVLARETYLEAVSAAIFAGNLAHDPSGRDVGMAARAAPLSRGPLAPDMLLDALATRLADGYAVSMRSVSAVLKILSEEDTSAQQSQRWLLLAGILAADLWDLGRWHDVAARHVAITRDTGALSELPLALDSCAVTHVFAGELATASSLVDEVATVSAAIGANQPPFGMLALAAIRGRESEARALIEGTVQGATALGQGLGVTVARYHHAVLCNGLAQYEEAASAARAAGAQPQDYGAPRWALAELVEASARTGATHVANEALEELIAATQTSGTEWALGVEATSRALLSKGPLAEDLYREGIERLSRTDVRVGLARTHLLYGEWLHREDRRRDARAQLGKAYELLTQFGAEAFAERARRELKATGATIRRRSAVSRTDLTAQEEQIARLAADGLTNPEIGARLFLSPHTIDWHLRKVYSKLGISSRREIVTALPETTSTSA